MATRDREGADEGIADLPGLGPASARRLAALGLGTRGDLERVGALGTMLALERHEGRRPSLNLLYAMVGALEGRPWQAVAREERLSLLLALDAHDERERSIRDERVAATDDPEVSHR